MTNRRHYTPEQKRDILLRHLRDKEPVSKICDEKKLQPSVFYQWQAQFFARGHVAFSSPQQAPSHQRELEAKILMMEARLLKKDTIIATISEEYVQLKKRNGEL